jgi:hypothetical protein
MEHSGVCLWSMEECQEIPILDKKEQQRFKKRDAQTSFPPASDPSGLIRELCAKDDKMKHVTYFSTCQYNGYRIYQTGWYNPRLVIGKCLIRISGLPHP